VELVVAVTGASGVVIGVRLLGILNEQSAYQVHLIVSEGGKAVIAHEVGPSVALPATYRWEPTDLTAPIASSSRAPDAMVVAPCSMKTMSSIAHGHSADLIGRTACARQHVAGSVTYDISVDAADHEVRKRPAVGCVQIVVHERRVHDIQHARDLLAGDPESTAAVEVLGDGRPLGGRQKRIRARHRIGAPITGVPDDHGKIGHVCRNALSLDLPA